MEETTKTQVDENISLLEKESKKTKNKQKELENFLDITEIQSKYKFKSLLYLYRNFLQEGFFNNFRNYIKLNKNRLKEEQDKIAKEYIEIEEKIKENDTKENKEKFVEVNSKKEKNINNIKKIDNLMNIGRTIKDMSVLNSVEEKILTDFSGINLKTTILDPETAESVEVDFKDIITKVSQEAHLKVKKKLEEYNKNQHEKMIFNYYLFQEGLLKDTVVDTLIKPYVSSIEDVEKNITITSTLNIFRGLNISSYNDINKEFRKMINFLYKNFPGATNDSKEIFEKKVQNQILLINKEGQQGYQFLIYDIKNGKEYFNVLRDYIIEETEKYNSKIVEKIKQIEKNKKNSGYTDLNDDANKKGFIPITSISCPLYLCSKDKFLATVQQCNLLLQNDQVIGKAFDLGEQTLDEYINVVSLGDEQTLNDEINKLYHVILKHLVELNVSDIHFHPYMQEDRGKIQYRLHGKMYDFKEIGSKAFNRLISVIENESKAEAKKEAPQGDGVIQDFVVNENLVVNFRVAVIGCPSKVDSNQQWKKHCILRVLVNDKIPTLQELNYRDDVVEEIRNITGSAEHGIFLVTGPTGSGKSTLLYSVLYEYSIKHNEKQIYSVENPIEKIVSTISQIEIDPNFNQDFKTVLKMLLRADPDVIFVGEIRDPETAELATDASETGHFVLATMHVNSALEVIERLEALEVENEKVKKTLTGAVAQRLITKLCPDCMKEVASDNFIEDMEKIHAVEIELPEDTMLHTKGNGCATCKQSGVVGRIPIIEIINFKRIEHFENPNELKQKLSNLGFKNMFDRALEYMLEPNNQVDYKSVISLYDSNTDVSGILEE